MTLKNENCFIDMGVLYGSWVQGNAIHWWPLPVYIDQLKLDAFLEPLFTQISNAGIGQLSLSFAQICDIDALLAASKGSSSDTITPILTDGYTVGSTGLHFLKYFATCANKSGMEVTLSFGGEIATATDMKVLADPKQQAAKLVDFLTTNGLSGVGFDIEGGNAVTVGADSNTLSFFKQLHEQLSTLKMKSRITLAGALLNGPTGPLKQIFANFDDYFDQVNLMLYSNNQYYLDADNVTWGIKQWLYQVGGDAAKLSIGFYDSIAYENPSASAGEQYQIPPGISRGQAAAWIYQKICTDLGKSPTDFAPPFWWTDDPRTLTTNKVLQDFYGAMLI